MKHLFTLLLLILTVKAGAQSLPAYLSPKPFSKFISRESNIIINNGFRVNPLSMSDNCLIVSGSISGRIEVKLYLSDDGETVIAEPVKRFTEGETVTVSYSGGIRGEEGDTMKPFSYSFTITPLKERIILTEEQKQMFAQSRGKVIDE